MKKYLTAIICSIVAFASMPKTFAQMPLPDGERGFKEKTDNKQQFDGKQRMRQEKLDDLDELLMMTQAGKNRRPGGMMQGPGPQGKGQDRGQGPQGAPGCMQQGQGPQGAPGCMQQGQGPQEGCMPPRQDGNNRKPGQRGGQGGPDGCFGQGGNMMPPQGDRQNRRGDQGRKGAPQMMQRNNMMMQQKMLKAILLEKYPEEIKKIIEQKKINDEANKKMVKEFKALVEKARASMKEEMEKRKADRQELAKLLQEYKKDKKAETLNQIKAKLSEGYDKRLENMKKRLENAETKLTEQKEKYKELSSDKEAELNKTLEKLTK